jgi:HEAT repeat protein
MSEESTESLLHQYEQAAVRHGNASTARAANIAGQKLASIYRELRERDARAMLLPLLNSPEASVRCWAAAHALEFDSDEAVAVLESLANGPPGPARANASMTLREWKAGRLTFP